MPIPQSTLLSKSRNYIHTMSEHIAMKSDGRSIKTAFLCHSHKDQDLVKGLLVFFKENSVNLYIDWQDHEMPDRPNAQTAQRIQAKIIQLDIFLFLATANARASRWCPWEIGYADSASKHIYIIPTSDYAGAYGNEYLDLYPRIDEGTNLEIQKNGMAVFPPQKTEGSWLNSAIL